MPAKTRHGKLRFLFRWIFRLTVWMAVLVAVLVLFWLRGALYNRFVRFPREEAAWQAIRAQRGEARAQAALGARYDFKAFNDAVVLGGNAPLDVMARNVDRYIARATA